MSRNPLYKLRLSDFLHDLRRADPFFWIAAALVVIILLARWLLK